MKKKHKLFKKHKTIRTPNLVQGMERYDDSKVEQKWVKITEIVVPTEYDKEQLLLAIEYIHYLRNIDTDYMGVNYLSHLYLTPDLITVKDVR